MRAMVMGVTSCPEVIACLCTSCWSRLTIIKVLEVLLKYYYT